MITCSVNSCSFGVRCLSFVNIYQNCASFPFGFAGEMWDLIELVPDKCLSFDFSFRTLDFRYMYYEAKFETLGMHFREHAYP